MTRPVDTGCQDKAFLTVDTTLAVTSQPYFANLAHLHMIFGQYVAEIINGLAGDMPPIMIGTGGDPIPFLAVAITTSPRADRPRRRTDRYHVDTEAAPFPPVPITSGTFDEAVAAAASGIRFALSSLEIPEEACRPLLVRTRVRHGTRTVVAMTLRYTPPDRARIPGTAPTC